MIQLKFVFNIMEDSKDELCSAIEKLIIDERLPEDEVSDRIARNLNETNRDLISKIVKAIGVKQSLIVYEETLKIEENGGIKREDKKGRKTPGGVFFYVIYHNNDILNENLKKIFSEEAQKKEKERRIHIKEERRKKTEQLKAQFIKEGLLGNNTNKES